VIFNPNLPTVLSAVALSGAALAYSLAVEPYRLQLTHPKVFVPTLPPALDGLSVLFLADPHVGRWGKREPLLLKLLQQVEPPDLLIWGGDFLQGGQGILPALRLVREVRALFPHCPAYAIMGNAEHKLRYRERAVFTGKLAATGMRVLLNEWEPLTIRGETLTIAGCDDPYYGWADVDKTLETAPLNKRFTLLLAHSPQVHTQAARKGVDLMLSGHTHGGQVRLPVLGPVKTQNPLSRRMDFGIFDRVRMTQILGYDPGGDLVTFVSRGIGVATVPRSRRTLGPRFLCLPEVARLTLHPSTQP
jgi:hypothetical protein